MLIKRKYYLLLALLLIAAIAIPNYWELGMMGFIGFFLAYLSKGSRKLNKAPVKK